MPDSPDAPFPNVALGSFYDYLEEGKPITIPFYYALYDLNRDGTPELVLGADLEKSGSIATIGLFSTDGNKPISLLAVEGLGANDAFGYELPVSLLTNGNYTIDLVVADTGIYEYQLGKDGYTAERTDFYAISDDGETFTDQSGKRLTSNEPNAQLGSLVTKLDWIRIQT